MKTFFTNHLHRQYDRISSWTLKRIEAFSNKIASPDIFIEEDDIAAYKISGYVYDMIEKRPLEVFDYEIDKNTQQEKACLYVNHTEKKLIIGYRGTDFKNINDVLSDVQIILGVSGVDKRMEDSLKFYDLVRAKYPDYKKHICGHSLGGTICYIVAKHRHPERCTVFNPGSAPNSFFLQMFTDTVKKAAWTNAVYTYKILGDLVSTFSFVGKTRVFRLNQMDPGALHRLERFTKEEIPEIIKPVEQ